MGLSNLLRGLFGAKPATTTDAPPDPGPELDLSRVAAHGSTPYSRYQELRQQVREATRQSALEDGDEEILRMTDEELDAHMGFSDEEARRQTE